VRFARTVMRIQREIRNGLKRICSVHLAINGIDPETVDFDIKMSNPSSIFEMAQIELRNAQADNARSLMQFFPKAWVMARVFDLPREEAERLIDQKMQERTDTLKGYAQQQVDITRDFPNVDPATLPMVESNTSFKEVLELVLRENLKSKADKEDKDVVR